MMNTMMVVTVVSLRVGHVTLRPSSRTWFRNSSGPVRFGAGRAGGVWRGGGGVDDPREVPRVTSIFFVASFDAMVPRTGETGRERENRGAVALGKPAPTAIIDLGVRPL